MKSVKFLKQFTPGIIIVVALIVSLSCLPSNLFSKDNSADSVIIPTDTIEVPDNSPGAITPEIPPADTPQQPSPEPISIDEPLNDVGPWLLIQSSDGLWAANPAGTALQQLTSENYWQVLKQAIQPAGNYVAFLTPGNYDFHHMALNLLSLPDGQTTKITDLTSTSTEAYADLGPGDSGFEALRAVGEQVSYAWSPDGSKLAFSGVMDGPSADIYLYTVQTGAITRVSQNPAQDFAPSWSPDGNHLLYLAADAFGTGAGWLMSGVWAADGNGSNPTQLFSSESAAEEIVGWLDDTTAVLATWDQPCGSQKLRLYDVETHQATMLYSDCFTSAAADGKFGVALYSNSSGVYLLTADDRTPALVDSAEDATIDPRYLGDQVFTVRYSSGGMATFGSISQFDHQVSPVQVISREINVTEYGAIWGWTSRNEAYPGAWITGPGVDIGRIFDGPAVLPIWSEDNNLLFFGIRDSVYDIYLTTFDNSYTDFHLVNTIESIPISVAWLGMD